MNTSTNISSKETPLSIDSLMCLLIEAERNLRESNLNTKKNSKSKKTERNNPKPQNKKKPNKKLNEMIYKPIEWEKQKFPENHGQLLPKANKVFSKTVLIEEIPILRENKELTIKKRIARNQSICSIGPGTSEAVKAKKILNKSIRKLERNSLAIFEFLPFNGINTEHCASVSENLRPGSNHDDLNVITSKLDNMIITDTIPSDAASAGMSESEKTNIHVQNSASKASKKGNTKFLNSDTTNTLREPSPHSQPKNTNKQSRKTDRQKNFTKKKPSFFAKKYDFNKSSDTLPDTCFEILEKLARGNIFGSLLTVENSDWKTPKGKKKDKGPLKNDKTFHSNAKDKVKPKDKAKKVSIKNKKAQKLNMKEKNLSIKVEPINEKNIGHKLLSKMGWTQGTGLGALSQGITDPIAPVTCRGKQGLGF